MADDKNDDICCLCYHENSTGENCSREDCPNKLDDTVFKDEGDLKNCCESAMKLSETVEGMKTIQSEFKEYLESNNVDDLASAVQVQAIEKAFHAGALSLMALIEHFSEQETETAAHLIDTIKQELFEFFAALPDKQD